MFAMKLILLAVFIDVVRCKQISFGDIPNIPYSVAIRAFCDKNPKYSWKCTATLLAERLLITTAHCIEKCLTTKHKILATAGANYKNESVQTREIDDFRLHKGYTKRGGLANDIAVMFVRKDFDYGKTVLAALPTLQLFSSGTETFIAGKEPVSDQQPNKKLKLYKQKVWKPENCRKIDLPKPGIYCATSCSKRYYPPGGDSGSGLVIEDPESVMIIGLVSYRVNTIPFVTFYTNVTHYLQWILHEYAKYVATTDSSEYADDDE